MKQLTKAEEDIMQILWLLEKANVKAIIEQLPKPNRHIIQCRPLLEFWKARAL